MKTAVEKLQSAGPAQVHVLDAKKAARFRADSMLIPSPWELRDAIEAIPKGEVRTMKQVRQQLADAANAGVTCPMVAGIFWRLLAEVYPELPWWRVTADGKPNPKLPGGAEAHRAKLAAEGVAI